MAKGISISEIIEIIRESGDEVEICATAEAQFDSAQQQVVVTLDSFARRIATSGHSERMPRPWLPAAEHVTEHLSHGEATTFVKDVFKSWVKKVRASVPHTVSRESCGGRQRTKAAKDLAK